MVDTTDLGSSHHDLAGLEGRESHKQNISDETASSRADIMFARGYLIVCTGLAVAAAVYFVFSFLDT